MIKIIEPIQSRCAIFRFSRFEEKDVVEYLSKISNIEKINLDLIFLSIKYLRDSALL